MGYKDFSGLRAIFRRETFRTLPKISGIMKSLLCVVFLLTLTTVSVSALQCNQCFVTSSWSACESQTTTATCDPSAGYSWPCAKVEATVTETGGNVYSKACLPQDLCEDYCNTMGDEFTACSAQCCYSDNCN